MKWPTIKIIFIFQTKNPVEKPRNFQVQFGSFGEPLLLGIFTVLLLLACLPTIHNYMNVCMYERMYVFSMQWKRFSLELHAFSKNRLNRLNNIRQRYARGFECRRLGDWVSCSFVHSFVRSFVCLFVCLLTCAFIHKLVKKREKRIQTSPLNKH